MLSIRTASLLLAALASASAFAVTVGSEGRAAAHDYAIDEVAGVTQAELT